MLTRNRISAGGRAELFFPAFFSGRTFRFALFTLVLLMLTGLSTELYGQSGGRKRERKTRRHGSAVLRQSKSRGHADEFAKGNSGRRGRLSRIFKKDKPAWQYRKSGSARSNQKENRFLFSRHRSKGRQENAVKTERKRKERTKNRERGNDTFSAKKHKRKK